MKCFKQLFYENKYSRIFYKLKIIASPKSFLYKIISNFIALSFLLFARNLYIKSLLGCNGDEFKCIISNKLDYILNDIYYCTHSAIYFLIFLFIIQLKLCSSYQLI